jgi:hypothetical protein
MVTMTVPLKKSLLKISHGFMTNTAVGDPKIRFLLTFKTVDIRSSTTIRFLSRNKNDE